MDIKDKVENVNQVPSHERRYTSCRERSSEGEPVEVYQDERGLFIGTGECQVASLLQNGEGFAEPAL